MAITDDDIALIRVYLGDTDSSKELVSDDSIELLWNLAEEAGTPIHKLIASDLAMGLAGKYSRAVSFSVEGLSISSSQKAEAFRQLANDLRNSYAADITSDSGAEVAPGRPEVFGVSIGTMDAVDSDTDRFASAFKIGMHDSRRA